LKIAFIIGATLGVIAIKTEPDGNLLVTTMCALIGGTLSVITWKLLKKIRNL
jgi:hypothetical protein